MATETNIQVPPIGFGSYLENILPKADAVAAGAFAASMSQIKNIETVNIQQFAQVVYSIETDRNLPSINGSNVPVDTTLVNSALPKVALGSGVYGTFTTSDFFGSMTGLPYPLTSIKTQISELETTKLKNIYREMYLAVTWEGATLTPVATQVSPGVWQLTGMTITDQGGGYGRGTAPAPTITLNNGATATCTIGTDDKNVTTFGRIIAVTITNPGTSGSNNFTASVQCPPTATLPVATNGNVATGGTNTVAGTVGWPTMNTVVQAYITQANTEISDIRTNKPKASTVLNTNWNIAGTALKIEQRARYIAIPPVPIPRSSTLSQYPSTLYSFVDSIPAYAQNTAPHGTAQSLESIADPCTVGGQSMIGMMRQERNQNRLLEVGIPLDNNIPDALSSEQEKILISNGTLPGASDGVPSQAGEDYTLPAWPTMAQCNGMSIAPEPVAYYDPNLPGLRTADISNPRTCGGTLETAPGNVASILEVTDLGPYNNGTGPAVGNTTIPVVIVNTNVPLGGGVPLGQGAEVPAEINGEIPIGSVTTVELEAITPPPANVLPPTLDTAYTSSVLSPSTFSTNDAVAKVTDSNCDCWEN